MGGGGRWERGEVWEEGEYWDRGQFSVVDIVTQDNTITHKLHHKGRR